MSNHRGLRLGVITLSFVQEHLFIINTNSCVFSTHHMTFTYASLTKTNTKIKYLYKSTIKTKNIIVDLVEGSPGINKKNISIKRVLTVQLALLQNYIYLLFIYLF